MIKHNNSKCNCEIFNLDVYCLVANNVGRGDGCPAYDSKDSSDEGDIEDNDEEEEPGLRNRSSQRVRQELHVSVPTNTVGTTPGENISPGMMSSPLPQNNKFGRGEGLLQCTTPQMGDHSARR